jgi:hypothetical protein
MTPAYRNHRVTALSRAAPPAQTFGYRIIAVQPYCVAAMAGGS